MAFIIDTESGSSYLVSNGRISREFFADRDVNGIGTIDRERGRLVRPAQVGYRAVLELTDRDGSERFVTTSRVTDVVTVRALPHNRAETVFGRPLRAHNASDPLTARQREAVLATLANLR